MFWIVVLLLPILPLTLFNVDGGFFNDSVEPDCADKGELLEEEITDEAFWDIAEKAAAAMFALACALDAIEFTFLLEEK